MKTILFFALALVWGSGVLAQEAAGDRQQIQETNPEKNPSVPTTIDFHGRLQDIGGNPLNGNLSITFSLYDAITGGAPLWTESCDVTFANGLFHVTLGETVPLEPVYFDGTDRYLGIMIAGDSELSPRIRFASVPYALHAGSTSDMQWEQSGDNIFNKNSGNVGIGSANPTSRLLVMGSASSPAIPSSSSNSILRLGICQHAGLNIGKSGTEPWSTWFQAGWNGITTDPISLQPLGGTIGIGTISPETKLHVTGEDSLRVIFSAAEGANSRSSGIMLRSTFGDDVQDHMPRNLALIKAHFDGGGWATASLAFHVAGNDCITDGGADPCERMRITDGGNVGIGTTTPSALLQVHGTGIGKGNVVFVGELKDAPGDPPAFDAGTRMMWYPDKAAFRAGHVTGTHWDKDSIGLFSMAMGRNTKATGISSIALGRGTTASGPTSTAFGFNTTASGWYSTAIGHGTTASGQRSTAMGEETTANGMNSTALGANTTAYSRCETVIGRWNTEYSGNIISWFNNDRLFVIGNGTGTENRSNAMTVRKNGNVGIGTDTPNALLHTDGTEKGKGNVVFVGELKESDPGNPPVQGAGTRLMWYPDKAAFRVGHLAPHSATNWDKDSIGVGSIAAGINTKATKSSAIALGNNCAATGNFSRAIGVTALASATHSTAFGSFPIASGPYSVAIGACSDGNTIASGFHAIAMGRNTVAPSFSETVIGSFNTIYEPNGFQNWNPADRLFVIGNGNHESQRSNALTVLKNGNVGIGTDNPTSHLSVNGTILSKKVIVSTSWADFVFDDEYHLRPLYEVESFIKEYNRLPEIPSAKDVKENGISLGEISASLLQKIEELTLYTIEQQKIIDELVKQNKELMIRVTEIEKK